MLRCSLIFCRRCFGGNAVVWISGRPPAIGGQIGGVCAVHVAKQGILADDIWLILPSECLLRADPGATTCQSLARERYGEGRRDTEEKGNRTLQKFGGRKKNIQRQEMPIQCDCESGLTCLYSGLSVKVVIFQFNVTEETTPKDI